MKMRPIFVVTCFFIFVTTLLQGCTIASHEEKNKFWVMQPGMQQLPPVGIVQTYPGYVSYPLLMSRKKLFEKVATCSGVFPVEIEVKITGGPAKSILAAMSWLLISGSSAFIIPYRSDNPRYAEFIVKMNGKELRKFSYEDAKYTWIATFGMFAGALSQKNDEYYVEELMADQFVNSFIIDLYKDKALLETLQK